VIPAGQIQFWKITHNGVDTHAIHFHLVNVQLINRVGWDGMVKPPDPNEVGWKETVRMNPLEDAIVALRAELPTLPFKLPDSVRPMDTTMPLGSTMGFTGVDPNGNPATVTNKMVNFGWEYVWHCHILGHEENDMMRPVIVQVAPSAPSGLAATVAGTSQVNLAWTASSGTVAGYRIERAIGIGAFAPVGTVAATILTYNDTTVALNRTYRYRVVAFNAWADSPPSNVIAVPVSLPRAPWNLVAVAPVAGATPPTVSLTWADNSNNESGFMIQRATDALFTVGLTTIAVGANVTTYTDATVAAGTTYYYRVQAINGIGGFAYSNTASATAAVGPLPAAPTNLAFVSATRTSIAISWTNNAVGAAGVYVQRSVSGGAWTTIVTLAPAATTYPDTGLPRNATITYSYRVLAFVNPGPIVSAPSNVVTARTLP